MKSIKKHLILVGVAIGIFLLIMALAILKDQLLPTTEPPQRLPQSFAECALYPGSTILESYPAVCVTRAGSRFIQPTDAQTIAPSPTADTHINSVCGGFAAMRCPQGFRCVLDGKYPDSGGTCVKEEEK